MSALARGMSSQQALALPLPVASNTVVINARCSLRVEADQRVIVVGGLPVHHYRAGDAVAEAYAMVFLVESGFAQQMDVARAFGRSVRTVRRHQARYVQGGMAALGREEGWRRGRRRISGQRLRSIELLKSQGMSNRAVAHRLGVSEKAIRKLVGASTPAESAQLAFTGMTTAAAGAPPAAVPSAKSADDDADARLRVDQRGHLMGFLYVDGHVRAYHGQRAISSKAYVARRHLAMPASTDYWINDRSGDPLLVVTGEVDAALTRALLRLLREVRDLVGERRVTIVFDRGGWSPKLFDTMIKDGFDLLTYRKGRCRRINERRFIARHAELDGCRVDYLLHDQPVRFLKGKLRLRQVTRLCDDGHQTQIITSRCDLRDIEVAYRMFERWRQENFFKYMREEFLLDALVDYRIEPEDPTRTIPNPERRALDKEVRAARADLAKLEREYGAAAADNAEQHRPTMRGFKIAHGRLGKQLRTARARVAQLFEQRRDVAKRVEIRDLSERAVVKLATERKHLTDIIKMVAYQAESDLVALLRPHYARVDQEGRTLLHELFAAAGDIRVSDSELHITLAPLSSPHRTLAAQALCQTLDQIATIFPGSRLRVRFSVRPPPRIGLAFPGSPVERSTATAVPPAP